MKQQTAVEWIENNIQSDMTFMEVLGLIRQAKEMEKEQIKDVWLDGRNSHSNGQDIMKQIKNL